MFLRYLPYLQTNKLGCHDFMDVGKRHKTPGSELYDSWHSKWHRYHVPISLASQIPAGVIVNGPGGFYTHSGFCATVGETPIQEI